MQEIRKEISEEAYNKYVGMSYKDRYNELIPTIPDEWMLAWVWILWALSEHRRKR